MNANLQNNLEQAAQNALKFAAQHGGRLHRHAGGFWSGQHLEGEWFGPQTTERLVAGNQMKFTETKNIRGTEVAVTAEVVVAN